MSSEMMRRSRCSRAGRDTCNVGVEGERGIFVLGCVLGRGRGVEREEGARLDSGDKSVRVRGVKCG